MGYSRMWGAAAIPEAKSRPTTCSLRRMDEGFGSNRAIVRRNSLPPVGANRSPPTEWLIRRRLRYTRRKPDLPHTLHPDVAHNLALAILGSSAAPALLLDGELAVVAASTS